MIILIGYFDAFYIILIHQKIALLDHPSHTQKLYLCLYFALHISFDHQYIFYKLTLLFVTVLLTKFIFAA